MHNRSPLKMHLFPTNGIVTRFLFGFWGKKTQIRFAKSEKYLKRLKCKAN